MCAVVASTTPTPTPTPDPCRAKVDSAITASMYDSWVKPECRDLLPRDYCHYSALKDDRNAA